MNKEYELSVYNRQDLIVDLVKGGQLMHCQINSYRLDSALKGVWGDRPHD